MLQGHHFAASTAYRLDDADWRTCDVVVADYRNTLVSFEDLRRECEAIQIPLVAISGGEMDYEPQLLKPFTTDELEKVIFAALVRHRERFGARKTSLRKRTA
jgi:hypothetical protein